MLLSLRLHHVGYDEWKRDPYRPRPTGYGPDDTVEYGYKSGGSLFSGVISDMWVRDFVQCIIPCIHKTFMLSEYFC